MSKICDYTKLHVISISFLTTPAMSWQSTITATLSTHCFLRLVKQNRLVEADSELIPSLKIFYSSFRFCHHFCCNIVGICHVYLCLNLKNCSCLEGQCYGLIVVWYMLNIGLGIGEKYCNAIF